MKVAGLGYKVFSVYCRGLNEYRFHAEVYEVPCTTFMRARNLKLSVCSSFDPYITLGPVRNRRGQVRGL